MQASAEQCRLHPHRGARKPREKTMSAVLATNPLEEVIAHDREATLHPFVNLHAYAHGQAEATVIESAKGSRVRDASGREYIDGFAGLYCVNIGYGRTEVAEAISKQAHQMAFAH